MPGLLHWPGVLQAGLEIAEPTSNMDLFPTLLGLAGAALPKDRYVTSRRVGPARLSARHALLSLRVASSWAPNPPPATGLMVGPPT